MKSPAMIQANAENRKEMVRVIAEYLGLEPHYEGTPSYNYTIGSITVTRDCEIIGNVDELEELKPLLVEHRYIGREESVVPTETEVTAEAIEKTSSIEGFECVSGGEDSDDDECVWNEGENSEGEPMTASTTTEPKSEPTDEPATTAMESEPSDEPTTPDEPTTADEPTEQDDDSTVAITLPCPELMVSGLINLTFMLHNKQHLLGKALGRQTIRIFDSVIQDLREQPPVNTEDFADHIADYRNSGQVIGFDYRAKCSNSSATEPDSRDKLLTLVFPYSSEGGYGMVCADLVARMVQAASKATRVKSDPLEPEEEAEKYYMNNWLVRLGFGGPEYKDHRRMLMQRLHGYAAFKCKERMDAHKAKLMAARKVERAAQQAETTVKEEATTMAKEEDSEMNMKEAVSIEA